MSAADGEGLLGAVDELVDRWLAACADEPVDRTSALLRAALDDPDGLAFTIGFIDRVVRPEDHSVAAAALRELAADPPAFLPPYLRAALRAGALASRAAPSLVVAAARRSLRALVSPLLLDADPRRLGRRIEELRRQGHSLNLNLLGEAVLGQVEADRRLHGITELIDRDDVDYVSLKVSAAVAPYSPWAVEQTAEEIRDRLLPLYRRAAANGTFINLDMEEYRDLDLTLAVFTGLLDHPDLLHAEAGVVVQAYLPDALQVMVRLQDWAAVRRTRGGAAIKVRVVKGANLPMERVESELHGWPVPVWPAKPETDANYKRVLDWALTPDRTRNVRIGVAGHNLYDIAWAWTLAQKRDITDAVDVEMLLGMAPGQARAVQRTVGPVRLYVPVVRSDAFDTAIAYLVRRLDEGANPQNFLSALDDPDVIRSRERRRFREAVARLDDRAPEPRRQQDRSLGPVAIPTAFTNAQDTDPALAANRSWAAKVLAAAPSSTLGADTVQRSLLADDAQLDAALATAHSAGWRTMSPADRARILRAAAAELERSRGRLVEVMAAECGKTLAEGDPEVSEAIDFALYYADSAEELATVDGATAVPVAVTTVTPPWNFPVAIPAGSTLAALAAGSSVLLKPASAARRCSAVLVEALWEAGVPRDALQLVRFDDRALAERLVARSDRVILTGSYETAAAFTRIKPGLRLLAETSGKNALVITPSADIDLAVRDLVRSAFGHAGQKCSAASLAILVGDVGTSRRFREQLVDAVRSLRVGAAWDPTTQMGPLVAPADGKLLRGLTELGPGESWLVEPRQVEGALWTPGVRDGVRRGSECHLVEYFGPVLGLMRARDLDEALELQNAVDYGLTAGLHSLDRDEIRHWLEHVEAGNTYVNKPTTGAIVRRQPFGGWKKSVVGAGAKAGGPNYLIALTDWEPTPSTAPATSAATDVPVVDAARRLGVADAALESLRRAVASDRDAWARLFGTARDVSGVDVEANVLRYRPTDVWVRGSEPASLLRVVHAGLTARAPMRVSVPADDTASELGALGCDVTVEADDEWRDRVASMTSGRIRLCDAGATRADLAAPASVARYTQPVTESGRVELLTFLREQAISITAHRFGSPWSTDGLI